MLRLSNRILFIFVMIDIISLAPPVASYAQERPRTKPSDVFFDPSFVKGSNYSPPDPLNRLSAAPIVAKGVTLRGWLTKGGDGNSCNIDVSNHVVDKNGRWVNNNTCQGFTGLEDVHYELVVDGDFIDSTYGVDPSLFNGAVLHGNYIDNQTNVLPIQDFTVGGQSIGIDINSFWLPNAATAPIQIHTELNAWHTRDSNWGPFHYNYKGRGPAPAGWIEKDYVSGLGNRASDNWWPFDPDDPEPTGSVLKEGDYVEMMGTLWQDSAHEGGNPENCWGQIYRNHDGWLEIHPVDSLRRLPSPGPSPDIDGRICEGRHQATDCRLYVL